MRRKGPETDSRAGGTHGPRAKYGARVFAYPDGVVQVKQTVKRGGGHNDRYVVDGDRERFVDPGNDAALGAAVRAATQGRL